MKDNPRLCYCEICHRAMDAVQFYISNNVEKYPPDGRLPVCKKCMTLCVDNWDPETFKPLLEQLDVPYIKDEWDILLKRYCEKKSPDQITGMTVLGRYLSKMKLKQWKDYRWADSERIQQEIDDRKASVLRMSGVDEDKIAARIKEDSESMVNRPVGFQMCQPAESYQPEPPVQLRQPAIEIQTEEEFESTLDLTEEDKTYLRLKWGRNYTPEEWVAMEQLYSDMSESYDIQTAGHKDTLKLICKTSLKANQLIDQGDIDGYQKMSKVYDALMKSGKFTAAQNKVESGEFVDSISELVAICEKQGFIERYYVDKPADKVDRCLEDLQSYTRTLVEDEMGLGDKIENAAKQLIEAHQNEYRIDDDKGLDQEDTFEETLFSDNAEQVIEDEEFQRLRELEDENEDSDAEYIQRVLNNEEE